uniref:hypothetical protein n=1 Tax=Pseudonocardia sp. CA-138482 TaxID=3240023 RepID=UPI003F49191A
MTGHLPPRPDPDSGEPQPPRAPTVVGAWAGHSERGRRTESFRPARAQDWFDKPAPMLELAEARRRRPLRSIASYAIYIALILGGGTALVMWGQPELRTDPLPYVIMSVAWLIATAIALLVRRTHTVYAGASWAGDAEDKGKILSTYDLARINVYGRPGPSARLQMVAPDKTFLLIPMGLLEANPRLWDLIYNGLRHSAAAGAEVDQPTRDLLRLPAARQPSA